MIILWDSFGDYEGNIGNHHFCFYNKQELNDWLKQEGYYLTPIGDAYYLSSDETNPEAEYSKEENVYVVSEGCLHIIYENWNVIIN